MSRTCHARSFTAIVVCLIVSSFGLEATADTPTVLVPSGVSFLANDLPSIFDPTIIWYTAPNCTATPPGAGLPNVVAAGAPGDEHSPARITRGAAYGAAPRLLLDVNPARPVATCNPYQLVSNIAQDGDSLFFVDNQGAAGHLELERRSRSANADDASTPLVELIPEATGGEVIVFGNVLFMIEQTAQGGIMAKFDKTTGAVLNPFVDIGNSIHSMQFDGRFLYWINGQDLRSADTTNNDQRKTIASGVITTYRPEGYDNECSPDGCFESAQVIYAIGNQLLNTDTISGGAFAFYTSVEPNAQILSLARDAINYFFFERRPVCAFCFDREDRLQRLSVGFNEMPALIFGPVNNGGPGFGGLISDYSYVYFTNRADGSLLKLADNAAAIPVYAFHATGLEVTQGIQNPNNDVPLIDGRRTFVRLYAQADGPGDVPNVTAALDVYGLNSYLGRLEPVNSVGKLLAVKAKPKRVNLNDSFLFELPVAWTHQTSLSFGGVLNPLRAVVENNYADDSTSSPILIVSASPRLPLGIVDFRYMYGGSLVTGGFTENYDSLNYMMRLYPLSSEGGGIADPGPGIHSTIDIVQDDAIGSHVDQTSKDCSSLPKGATTNECAGYYVLAQIQSMQAAGDLAKDRYTWGAIANNGALPNTRGFTPSGGTISVGPRLDFNGTPQQNYMSHEIGHALGRAHPASGGNPVCPNQSADDKSFPYPLGRIGNSTPKNNNDETALIGFDPGQTGNPQQGQTLRLPSTTGDVMSYCSPYWLSDYTYNALYDQMTFHPLAAAKPAASASPTAAAGMPSDWLLAFGHFSISAPTGSFESVRRLDAVADVPPLVAGGYALELRSGANALLASHPFMPAAVDEGDPDQRTFGLVVPFVAGTRSLRIVETATSKVVISRAISAHPPAISNVQLGGPIDPTTGKVTVTWTASDLDGDALGFTLSYSHDGGATWQPVKLSITGTSAVLDTSSLGGGDGVVRVEANDGTQSARAQSAPFTVPFRPPVVTIQNPSLALHVQWGQLVNFIGQADDPQGKPIPDGSYVWTSQRTNVPARTLGNGRSVSISDLDVGTNVVTLAATNANGKTGTASVQVVVGDTLAYPGPHLAASPSPVTWTVAQDVTAVQTASLAVSNAIGSDGFNFTAQSSETWIKVNGVAKAAVSSTAPVALGVTADPTGLPAGQTSVGHILLTNTNDPSDTLQVPVTLLKGSAFLGGVVADTDGDGVLDDVDDCVLVANPTQVDTDEDGYGNACDPDLNNDGVVNFVDLSRMKAVFFTSNALADLNGDGAVNFGDLAIMKRFFFEPPGPSGLACAGQVPCAAPPH